MSTKNTNGIENTQINGDVAVGRNANIGGDAKIKGDTHILGDLVVEGWIKAPNSDQGSSAIKSYTITTLDQSRGFKVINHQRGYRPIISVSDAEGNEVGVEIAYTDVEKTFIVRWEKEIKNMENGKITIV